MECADCKKLKEKIAKLEKKIKQLKIERALLLRSLNG